MIGDKGIIKTRVAGRKPSVIYVNADGYSAVKSSPSPMQTNPDLIIFPQERLSDLDLRFLVGMITSISGTDHKRVDEVTKACIDAGAKRVISNYLIWKKYTTAVHIELVRVADTEGHLTWEATDW